MFHGVINIYKEPGFTSHDVVAKLRGILRQKKIGHTGTLDPEAEGAEGLLMRADEKVEILYRKEKELKAPVKEGTTVGEICYLVDGEIWRRERLYAAWTVEAVDLSWCGRQILKRFLVAFP